MVTTDLGTSGAHDGLSGPDLPGDGACHADGERGRFRTTSAISGRFIEDRQLSDRSRVPNYLGALTDVFQELARVGDTGCAFAQPLEAMRRGLLEPENAGPENAGPETSRFLRDKAALAVIFVTAQDDCSFERAAFLDGVALDPIDTSRCYTHAEALVPIDAYVQFLKGLKRDPSKIAVAAVMGPTEPFSFQLVDGRWQINPACSFAGASALPAPRLQSFLDQFPNRTTTTSICQQDLSGGLQLFSGFEVPIGDPCINTTLADVDPFTSGRQEDCVVWHSFAPAEHREDEPIARCTPERSEPCWALEIDRQQCPMGSGERLVVHDGATELPDGTHVHAECVAD